ncbi:MAG: glutathione S-transferase family protein [Burkholderiaceae bacterium]
MDIDDDRLRVLGRRTSNNVQKVLWLLDELGIAFLQEDYGGPFGKTRAADYLRLNPNGTVPTLVDGGAVIWESNTILRYLAGRQGSPLYPADPLARAHVEQWMDWQLGTLTPAFRPLYVAMVREGRPAGQLDAERATATRLFDMLDADLAGQSFLAGAHLTLADIAVGPIVYRWFALQLAHAGQHHLHQYLARLSRRPAFQKHAMTELA